MIFLLVSPLFALWICADVCFLIIGSYIAQEYQITIWLRDLYMWWEGPLLKVYECELRIKGTSDKTSESLFEYNKIFMQILLEHWYYFWNTWDQDESINDEIFSCTSAPLFHDKRNLSFIPECNSKVKAWGKIVSYSHQWNEVIQLTSTWQKNHFKSLCVANKTQMSPLRE